MPGTGGQNFWDEMRTLLVLSVVPALSSPFSDAEMLQSKWMPGIAACLNVARREGRAQTAALQKFNSEK